MLTRQHDDDTVRTDNDNASTPPALERANSGLNRSPSSDRSSLTLDTRSDGGNVRVSLAYGKSPSLCSVEEESEMFSKQASSLSFLEGMAQRVARSPKTYFWASFLTVLAMSGLSMYFGGFRIQVNNVGWPSRGTLVSNRESQLHLVNRNRWHLVEEENDCLWEDLTTHVQLGWEVFSPGQTDTAREEERGCKVHGRRRGLLEDGGVALASEWQQKQREEQEEALVGDLVQEPRKNLTTLLDQCNVGWYSSAELMAHERLWPVWKLKSRDPEASILDPPRLRELCEAEENTQRLLREQGHCFGCDNGDCLPPLSPVMYARFIVRDGFAKNCRELAEEWAPHQHKTEERWKQCVAYIKEVGAAKFLIHRGPCPHIFSPSFVDKDFDQSGKLKYTSSVFLTTIGTAVDMYAMNDQFDRGSDLLEGAYDTNIFRFLNMYANDVVIRDVGLAAGSAIATAVAMLIHTRSPFLTLVGIIQIGLSFPLAYGIYHFLGGLVFFPFLNLIGVFVAFALGADHVFVAVDKWKNARRERPNATTEEVAIVALPSAASAMLLTTTTTAVAFFGSAICPVASIRLFAIFCGLLIALDYIVDVLVMFPCLCIYDAYRHRPNYCIDWRSRKQESEKTNDESSSSHSSLDLEKHVEEELIEDEQTGEWRVSKARTSVATSALEEEDDLTEDLTKTQASSAGPFEDELVKPNLIQRILNFYYHVLHTCRWSLLVVCMAALGISLWGATTFTVPETTANIQMLGPKVEYEKSRVWRMELFTQSIMVEAGSTAHVVWGLTPADTGDHNNPLTFTTLELDETFEPASERAQIYMRDFCDKLYAQEFAEAPTEEFECPIKMFDDWLEVQSGIPQENQDEIYVENCEGATGMPIPQQSLHACLSAWALQVKNEDILSWNGIVKIITFPYGSRVSIDSPNKELGSEWHLMEKWMDTELVNAPVELSNAYFTSNDFWVWDTSYYVYRTALDSGAIAIGLSAVVILLSSRSISMTLFSAISVVYVLVSVTALMSALGWTLGFLESICFTILIGLSADFVIHLSHAYTELPGDVDRHTRTKYALINLGPSVLAAGFTTVAGATVMLFTIIYFFRVFAMVLFFSIIQATIGSLVVFLVLTDCLGPSNPTYLFDKLFWCIDNRKEKKRKRRTEMQPHKQQQRGQPGELEPETRRTSFKQTDSENPQPMMEAGVVKQQEQGNLEQRDQRRPGEKVESETSDSTASGASSEGIVVEC